MPLASVAIYMVSGHAQESAVARIEGLYSKLPWRFIGPEGNRVIAVTGVPGDPLVYYALKSTPAGKVTVTIIDQKGQAVRTLPGTNVTGINRIHWDLRYEPSKAIWMRTRPLGATSTPNVREGWRSPDGGQLSVLAPPGTYAVKLSVAGRELTRPLTVIKDPHSGGTEADLQTQMTTLFELRRDMERAADLVNDIEVRRSQIEEAARFVDDQAIKKASDELNQKLIAVEKTLVELQPRAGGGSKLARKLSYLASEVASSDFKPTDQQLEVQKLLEERLATCERQFDAMRTRDLRAFNELLWQR